MTRLSAEPDIIIRCNRRIGRCVVSANNHAARAWMANSVPTAIRNGNRILFHIEEDQLGDIKAELRIAFLTWGIIEDNDP